MSPLTVSVYLLDAPRRAGEAYDYLLPEEWEAACVPGQFLLVPFGAGNKPSYAVAASVGRRESTRKLKCVSAVLPPAFRLTVEILRLCLFLSVHTLCSVGEALRAVFPTAALGLAYEVYDLTGAALPRGEKQRAAYAFLAAHPGVTGKEATAALGGNAAATLGALVRGGYARKEWKIQKELRPRTVRMYRLACPAEEANALLAGGKGTFRTETQRTVFRFLADEGECREGDILSRLNISASPLHTLVARGLLSMTEREEPRDPYAALAQKRDFSPVALSRAQEEAYEKLASLADAEKAACALLHGVTGSGKTRVMMKLLDKVLSAGKQAILLVPEIALTPQTVGIFCARYGERVSVLHSRLSAGERFDAYRKIASGGTDLVIGTRSAIFAPLSRLGLIILDEEHEHTYKSDSAPRYHAREVASYRAGKNGALVVLASATPSVESYYKAETGKYTLVPLTERYGGALLPRVEVVDMRAEVKAGNLSPVSGCLHEKLGQVKAADRQAILFLNRRGYYHAVSCRGCGEALMCPHCSVSLSYHSDYGAPYLLCHACGYKAAVPDACPACGSDKLSFVGVGTQKAEAVLAAEGFRVIRMDADTTGTKTSYERLLGRFRNGEADVLLGTQMVTKGHDFPTVSLAGVLLADSSLYMSDFRAAERTFSLLTQVVGRAGRTQEPGIAVIQTYCPDNKVIRWAAKQDYESFYREEIAFRRAMLYPPFCDIAAVFLSHDNEAELLGAATGAAGLLSRLFGRDKSLPAEIFGPLALQNYRVAEKFRVKLLIKCRLGTAVRALFGTFLSEFREQFPAVGAAVDFNPTDT